ncbi:MAG: ScpA family protein [Granulosicoccus sp.]
MSVDPPQPQADPSSSTEEHNLAVDGNLAEVLAPTGHIALIRGEPLTQLPLDLYIPPDALEVILEAFEGPLDLLLYLIKRQNLDILNIPIADITAQYMKYIGMMETMKFELAAEYLVMAAMLAEIKSRMLLPRIDEDGDDENDPRAELIRRLQEYERIKTGAVSLDEMPRMERDHQQLKVVPPTIEREVPQPEVSMKELMLALRDVAERAERMGHHSISRETLSVRARMSHVLSVLKIGEFCEFSTLFNPEEGRLGVVVTFLAVLELCKEAAIDIVQSEPFAPIYLKPRSKSVTPADADPPADAEPPAFRTHDSD